jgi:2-polyprenyl-3-methyl-5-hydroxy-6-metoxy-1,4-benzoquinol methylase
MSDAPKSGHVAVEEAVKRCYSTWGETYYRDYYGPDAGYPPVHLPLITSLVDQAGPGRLLDAGCGPASMLRHLVRSGRELYGFDLTPEMVLEARCVMGELGVAPERVWQGSVLERGAFDCPAERATPYDAAICVGVFPHLREADEIHVIRNLHDCLRPGGIAVVEARNELFSLFTLNRYSHQLFLERLVPVRTLRQHAGDEAAGLDAALRELEGMFRTDLPPVRKGKQDEPGYDEVVSRLHNPLVLGRQFAQAGFSQVRTLFYHFHCLPPMLSAQAPKLFREQSLAMEVDPDDWRGYFMASAFVVVATRA